MSRPALLEPVETISRCLGCGGWVWLVDINGCDTCRAYWARHGVA